jgi:hypothetical protein
VKFIPIRKRRRKMTDNTEKELAGFRNPLTNQTITLDSSDPEIGSQIREICKWIEDDLNCGVWHPSCGGDTFIVDSGLPSENKMKFCCFCGKELIEVAYKDLEEKP